MVESVVGICIGCGVAAVGIGVAAVAVVYAIRCKKQLKREQTANEIKAAVQNRVIGIEEQYSPADQILKNAGVDVGVIKKDNLLRYAAMLCSERHFIYDEAYWEDFIEGLIKVMNADRK